jgi:hypothetical protein
VANWNPAATSTLGLEWFPYAQGSVSLDAAGKMAAVSLNQTATGGSATLNANIANIGIPIRGGIYAVEIYDNETGVPVDAVQSSFCYPNADVSGNGTGTGQWRTSGGSGSNIYANIDETTLTDFSGDYIQAGSSNTIVKYLGRVTAASPSLTGKRVLGVKLVTRLGGYSCPVAIMGLNIGGVDYSAGSYSVSSWYPGQTPRTFSKTWWFNPATKKPWTIADITAFNSTDEWFITRGNSRQLIVFQAYLQVYYCTENRIAVGYMDDSASALTANAWTTVPVLTPTGGAWTKDTTGRHLYTVRRVSNTGSIKIPYLTAADVNILASGWTPTVDPTYGTITAMGTANNHLMPVIQRQTTGPADIADSIAYVNPVAALVSNGQNAEQEVSAPAATAYGKFQFLVKPGDATANLSVILKRRDATAIGGSAFVLTPAAAAALPDVGGGWRFSQGSMATPTNNLNPAAQHFIEFSSTSGSPWTIQALDTLNAGNTTTFGGTTDRAVVNGVEADRYELAATVGTVPTPPTNFVAALGSQAVSETICCVTSIGRTDLTWDAVVYTTGYEGFHGYEIQRSEDGGTTWTTVALLVDEGASSWKDYEAKRGVGAKYRIRFIRTDGAISDWATAAATITKPVVSNTLFLVSNYEPTFNVAYEYRPGKSYDFNEADELVLTPLHMADYQAAFRPIEYRGTTANYTMLVGADDKVPVGGGKGWSAFGPLRDIARAALPYVCLLDYNGNRMLAALSVPSGEEEQPMALYIAEMAATEVGVDPYPVSS